MQSCFDKTTIKFIVDAKPKVTPLLTSLTTKCDEELDPLIKKAKFDTSTFSAAILNGQLTSDFSISYKDVNNIVYTSLPNPFETTTQNVTVTVTNVLNANCTTNYTIPFIVNPTPKINLNANGQENQLVCSNIPSFTITLDAGIIPTLPVIPITAYNYKWFKNNVAISPPETNYTLDVNTPGEYSVEVTFNAPNECPKIRKIKVNASDVAIINSIEITDLSDINSVTVNLLATSLGNYVFSIDDSYGPYQESPFFTNIDIGQHTIYVKDLNGCGITSKQIYVLGAPKFFTPNGDTINDTWNIKGIDPTKNANSIIQIFDRYGKLIKQISPVGQGWDGTLNSIPLPSDDYWFNVKFEDGRSAKGHFSLKR